MHCMHYARWNCDYWIAMYHVGATRILLGANVLEQNESKLSNVQHFAVSLRKNVKDTSASQEGHNIFSQESQSVI